jgi:hypothetical protein
MSTHALRTAKRCGIPANGGMIGYAECDLEWGHDGMVHSNTGDGFYSPHTEKKHRRRQAKRRATHRVGEDGGR